VSTPLRWTEVVLWSSIDSTSTQVQVQVFYVVLRGWLKPAQSPLPIWKTALELSTLSAITGSSTATDECTSTSS